MTIFNDDPTERHLLKPLIEKDFAPLSPDERGPDGKLPKLRRLEKSIYGLESFPVGVLLQAFREIFAGFDRWKYVDEDEKNSNIFIFDQLPEGMDEEDLKPAIVTARGSIVPMNINGRGRNFTYNEEKNVNIFFDLLQTQMTIHCLSREGVEAGSIASAVFGVLMSMEIDLKRRGVHALVGHVLGPEGVPALGASYEYVDVPVQVVLQYAWSWAYRSGEPCTFGEGEAIILEAC